jgi:quinol monooxygenase YgiN
MSESVIVTVTFVPADGARDNVISALERGIAEVHSEPGCELYSLHEVPDGTFFMIEKWTSAVELDAHAAGQTVARLDASLEGLLAEAAVITRIVPFPAGTRSQGQL